MRSYPWTPAEVRRLLPTVTATVAGTTYSMVRVFYATDAMSRVYVPELDRHYTATWVEIAKALNDGTALTLIG